MWLGQYLGHESILVEIFNVEDFAKHFMILLGDLVDVGDQILILKEKPPELFVIICILIKVWWFSSALNLLHVILSDLIWW